MTAFTYVDAEFETRQWSMRIDHTRPYLVAGPNAKRKALYVRIGLDGFLPYEPGTIHIFPDDVAPSMVSPDGNPYVGGGPGYSGFNGLVLGNGYNIAEDSGLSGVTMKPNGSPGTVIKGTAGVQLMAMPDIAYTTLTPAEQSVWWNSIMINVLEESYL